MHTRIYDYVYINMYKEPCSNSSQFQKLLGKFHLACSKIPHNAGNTIHKKCIYHTYTHETPRCVNSYIVDIDIFM